MMATQVFEDVLEIDTPYIVEGDEMKFQENMLENTAAAENTTNEGVSDDDDDEDDGINIVIGETQLSKMEHFQFHDYNIMKSLTNDVETTEELKQLMEKSLNANSANVIPITIIYDEIIIPILDHSQPISDHLRCLVWKNEVSYRRYFMKNNSLFEKLIETIAANNKTNIGEYVAFFAAKYQKMKRDIWKTNHNNNHYTNGDFNQQDNNSMYKNLYFYNEFSIIVLKDGKFVDAAIHGLYSSINSVINKYKPKKIYCYGTENSAIGAFIRYPYQPFYESLHTRVQFVAGRMQNEMAKIMFCHQNKMFCAFCRCIDTIITYYKQLKLQDLMPIKVNTFKPLNTPDKSYKIQTLREIINARRLERKKRMLSNKPTNTVNYICINRVPIKRLQHAKKYSKNYYKHNVRNMPK